MLCPAMIAQLGLVWQKLERVILADGTDGDVDVYEGIVIWDGQPRTMFVAEAEATPSAGMAFLEGSELTIQVRPQGRVVITAMP